MKHLYKLIAISIILAVTASLNTMPASAATHPCQIGVNDPSKAKMNFGTNVPVILIHGINGSPADWTSRKGSSVCKDIDSLPGVQVALNFKYTGGVWSRIAQDFGPQIDKIAKQSAQNGGLGKVIVVGYSLGTTITRTAIKTQDLGSKVGQVITIAAPDLNSWESYPAGVVVRAIGGDITNAIVKGKKTTYIHTKSDGLFGLDWTLK